MKSLIVFPGGAVVVCRLSWESLVKQATLHPDRIVMVDE